MSELQLLQINVVLYFVSFIYFALRYKIFNLSTILFGLYFMSSLFSLLYYQNPLFAYTFTAEGSIEYESILFLFAVNFLLCSSLKNFSLNKKGFILTNFNKPLIDIFHKIIFYVTLLLFIFSIPSMLQVLSSSNFAELRAETYENGGFGPSSFFIGILGRIFGACKSLLLFFALSRLLLFREKCKLNYYSIILYFLSILQVMLVHVSRGALVFRLLEFFIIIIIFRTLLDSSLKKKIMKFSIITITGFFLLFSAITFSRFQEGNEAGAGLFANLRYAGESQLNFTGLMYGKTNGKSLGYRIFPLYRRVLGLRYAGEDGISQESVSAYMDRYNPNGPNYVFYQLAGSYYLAFGGVCTFLIALFFNFYARRQFRQNRKQSYFSIYLVGFFCVYIGNGIFFPMYRTEAGNILFLFLIIISFILKFGKTMSVFINKI